MQLQNQVVSLDLAKRLKELGVKQESYFRWEERYSVTESFVGQVSQGKKGNFYDEYHLMQTPSGFTTADIKWNQSDLNRIDQTSYPAYTVAELGEMLPEFSAGVNPSTTEFPAEGYSDGIRTNHFKINDDWCSEIDTETYIEGFDFYQMPPFGAKTEADCRAKMLIYLLENDLIK